LHIIAQVVARHDTQLPTTMTNSFFINSLTFNDWIGLES